MFVRRQEVPSAKSTAPTPIWTWTKALLTQTPVLTAMCGSAGKAQRRASAPRPEIHRFGASAASAKACRLGRTPAGRSQPVLDTGGDDSLVREIVDHDADYRWRIRIRGIWPEHELNDSNRRILAGGGDGVNAKSDLLRKGKARDAENEREQKKQSLHQVWFRGNSIEHGKLRDRKMILGAQALANPTSGGMDRKARAERW